MIAIHKSEAPEGLAELRRENANNPDAYSSLRGPLKQRVRNSLAREQGYLCAYCMGRLPRSDAHTNPQPIIIEHIVPRHPEAGQTAGEPLEYANMVASCRGHNPGYGETTCDRHKANTAFQKVHPCIPETLVSICYDMDGTIKALDAQVYSDLTDVLNLNSSKAPVKSERKAALEALLGDILTHEEDLILYCKMLLTGFLEETEEKTPYVGILIWYLKTLLTDRI